eukprot:CAMPEP_0183357692 /NCGR_PEP_ID=MMETSP0164_2-20130417/47033_1 /TAXON_ID=221442 /ORGANISM="Coccolithus pelagicus ssp braarudi, Strain PLY182g" /LENGTH=56 /DNA_ID=CAMNT_0025531375 /DNA_START=358 /DNA_END=528 /DNA_ORIENTATION=+
MRALQGWQVMMRSQLASLVPKTAIPYVLGNLLQGVLFKASKELSHTPAGDYARTSE